MTEMQDVDVEVGVSDVLKCDSWLRGKIKNARRLCCACYEADGETSKEQRLSKACHERRLSDVKSSFFSV